MAEKLLHANGSYLTAFILLHGIAQIVEGVQMHANENIAKQIRDLEIPAFQFPIFVSLRTPPGEIHFRDAKSGELRGKIIGIGSQGGN